MEELLTRSDVMKILKVSYKTVVNWEEKGILKPLKFKEAGTRSVVRFRKSDIEKLIENKGGENGEWEDKRKI